MIPPPLKPAAAVLPVTALSVIVTRPSFRLSTPPALKALPGSVTSLPETVLSRIVSVASFRLWIPPPAKPPPATLSVAVLRRSVSVPRIELVIAPPSKPEVVAPLRIVRSASVETGAGGPPSASL